VPHAIRLLSFFALQLPVFTYLITQFQALGIEVRCWSAAVDGFFCWLLNRGSCIRP